MANAPDQAASDGGEGDNSAKLIDMELIISRLLRVGVYTSSAVILAGLLMMIFTRSTGYSPMGAYHLQSLLRYHPHHPEEFPVSAPAVVSGALALKPFAIIMLGVLLLIATPVFRVAVSLVAFAFEKDRAYVWITLYVLVVLIISFLLGKSVG
ncbi:MAG TPA: DUF1634 domain-containing protein [Armatimonadota bacterium]|nr:DUF1634 domain-containing protein [Armatimonadota bacterium]